MKPQVFLLAASALLLAACGDSTGPGNPARVEVTPPNATLEAIGATQQFSAEVLAKNGKAIKAGSITWSSSNPAVASVDENGVATAVKDGNVTISAHVEAIVGTANLDVSPVPETITKVAGDEQIGGITTPLAVAPTVELLDKNGHPVEGARVTFSVVAGGGTVAPSSALTNADGNASTTWQLGCSNETPQRLEATFGTLTVSFTATADLSELAVCPNPVPDGRVSLAYSTQLIAVGGDQSTLTWSLNGTLPSGLTFHDNGQISGTPLATGLSSFEAIAEDAAGHSASRELDLRVCEAPLSLAPGESRILTPSGYEGCGFFLPSGSAGDRYRFGIVYASPDTIASDVPTVAVTILRQSAAGALAPEASAAPLTRFLDGGLAQGGQEIAGREPIFVPGLAEAVAEAEATEALHQRIRRAEREMIRSLGPDARPLPDRRRLLLVSGPRAPAPEKTSFINPKEFTSCAVGETRRAIKVAENDVMVIYQDSIQRADTAMTTAHAQMMLDYFRDYGQQVLDDYFGGTTDLDGNGKIDVFVTPVVEEGTAAFVWSGDFFPRTAANPQDACAASNEMELIRFSLSTIRAMTGGNYQALGTVVHESKHISSLYKSIVRGHYQPDWVEEGTAEIAGEMSSRLAWAAAGGPAAGAEIVRSDLTDITPEDYAIVLKMARTVAYLASQPNSVVTTPQHAAEEHSVYGSGWHFHRWLGDAYGHAAVPLADSSLFRVLNDSLTVTGIAGIRQNTGGKTWTELMQEYALAVMVNGTGAPVGAYPFTTYDFPSFNLSFDYPGKPTGNYPWPVNVSGEDSTAAWISAIYTGFIGPSGLRVFDLTSDGTGQGLKITVATSFAAYPMRIVAVRIH